MTEIQVKRNNVYIQQVGLLNNKEVAIRAL